MFSRKILTFCSIFNRPILIIYICIDEDDFEFSTKKDSKKENEWEDADENENEACGGDTITSKIDENNNKMVQCQLCNDEYSETQIEFHLVGVHGVYGPKELYIEPQSPPFSGPKYSKSPVDYDAIEPRDYWSTQERTSSWIRTRGQIALEFLRRTPSPIEDNHHGRNQNLGQDQNIDINNSFLEESTIVKNTTSKMVLCRLCQDEYSETHMEFHLVGVHGVDGPKEMYIYESNDLNRSIFDLEELVQEYNTTKETLVFLDRYVIFSKKI